MKPLLTVICLTYAAFAQTPQRQLPQAGASYVIGPGDKIYVTGNVVFIPNCFRTDANGMMTTCNHRRYQPLLKDVKAAGLTSTQLLASITKELKEKHIENPYMYIEVIVIDMHGQFRDSAQTSTVYERLRQQPQRAPTLVDSADWVGFPI